MLSATNFILRKGELPVVLPAVAEAGAGLFAELELLRGGHGGGGGD